MNLNNKYQDVDQIIHSVQSYSDIEKLRKYIQENSKAPDEVMREHITACEEALKVYDKDFFRRWSTPFLQVKLEECQQQNNVLHADIYEAEIRSRKA